MVWIEECPSRNLICLRSPPALRQSLAQVRRRSCAPKRSMPICLADCSTPDQTTQLLSSFLFSLPAFDTGRSSRPATIFAAASQASVLCLTG